jgi:precorrin-6x reductase
MKKLLIFGGTSDEHNLLNGLSPYRLQITLCVASAYGKMMTPDDYPGLDVREGRLDAPQIADLIRDGAFFCVVDATHPYAVEVTSNIKAAASETHIPYLRLGRPKSDLKNTIVADTAREAASLLNETVGNVLLTTGSKELTVFTEVKDYRTRVFPRVLPTVDSIDACVQNGFPANHIIAMHGPFSKELNLALMRQFNIRTIVTKDGGVQGGFPEKLEAAEELGASVIVIRRPEDDAQTFDDTIERIVKLLEEAQ